MKYFISSKLIQITIILCFFTFLIPLDSFAAKWAIVSADKANVYSDVEMTSVIGFVKKGKKVRVGEVSKNQGKLIAIIVSKKIAYIAVSDLKTGVEVESLKTITQKLRDKESQVQSQHRIGIYGGMYQGYFVGNDFKDSLGDGLLFVGGGLRGYYDDFKDGTGHRIGLEYLTAVKDDVVISFLSLPYSWKFFEEKSTTDGKDFVVYAGPVLMPYINIAIGSTFSETGFGVGGEIGAEWRKPIDKYFTFHLELNYEHVKFFNMALPQDSIYPYQFDPYLHGVKLLGHFIFKY